MPSHIGQWIEHEASKLELLVARTIFRSELGQDGSGPTLREELVLVGQPASSQKESRFKKASITVVSVPAKSAYDRHASGEVVLGFARVLDGETLEVGIRMDP